MTKVVVIHCYRAPRSIFFNMDSWDPFREQFTYKARKKCATRPTIICVSLKNLERMISNGFSFTLSMAAGRSSCQRNQTHWNRGCHQFVAIGISSKSSSFFCWLAGSSLARGARRKSRNNFLNSSLSAAADCSDKTWPVSRNSFPPSYKDCWIQERWSSVVR